MVSNSNEQHALNQRSPAEGKGKGQKLLAQGIALGIKAMSKAPCKGNSFNIARSFKAFALTGRQVTAQNNPGRCPGLRVSAPSGRVAPVSFCPFRACCSCELLPLQGVLLL